VPDSKGIKGLSPGLVTVLVVIQEVISVYCAVKI